MKSGRTWWRLVFKAKEHDKVIHDFTMPPFSTHEDVMRAASGILFDNYWCNDHTNTLSVTQIEG